MSETVVITRGATFRHRLPFDVSLKGAEFVCNVSAMGSGRHIASLSVREIDVDALCLLEVEGPTDDWPLTELSMEARANVSGDTIISETINIKVRRNVTFQTP